MTNTHPTLTSDDITFATLAQVLQIHGFFLPPLILFFIKRDSKFVAFHSLQALIFQIIIVSINFTLMGCFKAFLFTHLPPQGSHEPPKFIFFFPLIWLFIMSNWALSWFVGIAYAVKAGRGEWARYPIIGKLTVRILKMDEFADP